MIVGHSVAAAPRCAGPCGACVAAAYVDAAAHAAVPLFLIVSGVAVGARYWDACPARHFYSRRAARLLPPYIVASLFYMTVLSPYEGPVSPCLVVPGRLLSGSGYYHLWYVVFILQLYPADSPLLLWLAQRLPTPACQELACLHRLHRAISPSGCACNWMHVGRVVCGGDWLRVGNLIIQQAHFRGLILQCLQLCAEPGLYFIRPGPVCVALGRYLSSPSLVHLVDRLWLGPNRWRCHTGLSKQSLV